MEGRQRPGPTAMALKIILKIALMSSLVCLISSQTLPDGHQDDSLLDKPLVVDFGIGLILAEDGCTKSSLCPNPMETKSKVLPKWEDSNCRCDDACAMYGDCCLNARLYDLEQARIAAHHWKCIGLEGVGPYGQYMLTTCPATWTDPEIRASCEKRYAGDDNGGFQTVSIMPQTDPLTMLPVTNRRTTFTYQNYYCAVCNEDEEEVVFWIPSIDCPDLRQYNNTYGNVSNVYVWDKLQYDPEMKSWGIYLNNYNVTNQRTSSETRNSSFAECRVFVKMPDTVVDMVRQCRPWEDDCPKDYTNDIIRNACHSYTATVYGSRVLDSTYRNVHCALCNNEELKLLSCQSQLRYRNVVSFAPSLAFLFDINENSGQLVGAKWKCASRGEVYDPFFKRCRQMMCASPRYKLNRGRCILAESPTTAPRPMSTTISKEPNTTVVISQTPSTTLSGSGRNDSSVTTTTTTTGSDLPQYTVMTSITELGTTTITPTEDCTRFDITKSLYSIYKNGSIYIKEYGRLFTVDDYVTTEDGSILICIPFAVDDATYLYQQKFSVVLVYITLACLGVSLTCLTFHLVAFVLVPPLRNLSGKNLASLCMSLLVAYVTFILSQFNAVVSKPACTSIAVISYYSFLASFFWMNCIAYDVWRTLRMATSELRVSSGQQWHKFMAYSAYSWFGPAIVVAISIIVENSSKVPPVFRPTFGHLMCWFGNRRALLIFFVVPVLTIVVLNAIMFVCSACIIVGTTQSSPIHQPRNKSKRNFKLYLRLALIMGLSWIFGIVAGQVDVEPLWYIFIILNALQGLFIFLSFTCTEKVRVYIRDRVFLKKSSYYSSTRGTRSTRKFELEGRDSGSGESQSSQTSRLSISRSSQNDKSLGMM